MSSIALDILLHLNLKSKDLTACVSFANRVLEHNSMLKMARSSKFNLIVSDFFYLPHVYCNIFREKHPPGNYVCTHEIIWKVTRCPLTGKWIKTREVKLCLVYDETCIWNQEFQREICFEPLTIVNSLRKEIKGTFKWIRYLS